MPKPPYIDSVLEESGEAGFDPSKDIKETFELGGTQPGGGDTFSLDAAEATLVYLINWRKRRSFTRWLLGFAYADQGPPFRLHRENPQIHPAFPKLTAATVHFSSVAPKSNSSTGAPDKAPNFPAVFPSLNGIDKTGFYDSCYATVRFTRQNFNFRSDEYVGAIHTEVPGALELDRNCVITTQPTVELLTAEGGKGQLQWSEGRTPMAPPSPAPVIKTVVANLFAQRVSKVKIVLQLYWWPEAYLSTDGQIPFYKKLYSCVGKVNATSFLGLPAGTLLCDAPKTERFQFPVGTFDNLGAFFGVNLTIPLTYFNPTLGVPDGNEKDNTKARGHRTLINQGDGKWYGVMREEKTDPLTKWLLEEADFNRMLDHISAP